MFLFLIATCKKTYTNIHELHKNITYVNKFFTFFKHL